jgi:signal transduction histidine kinase
MKSQWTSAPPASLPRKPNIIAGLLARLNRISGRLVVPYLVLIVALALIGAFFSTFLVSSSFLERLLNQLNQATRLASDSVVEQEERNLSAVRTVSYTDGIFEAVQSRDVAKLEEFLRTISLSHDVETIVILDLNGFELMTRSWDPVSGNVELAGGSDFSSFDIVQKLLTGLADDQGDKYIDIIPGNRGDTLVTGSPIFNLETGEVNGVALVGLSLATIQAEVQSRLPYGSDAIFLDNDFDLIAASAPDIDADLPILQQRALALSATELLEAQNIEFRGLDYQVAFTPLIFRGQQHGWIVVRMTTDYVTTNSLTNRAFIIAMFCVAAVAVFGIGYILARGISRPIETLNRMTQAVAAGDLNQEMAIKRGDEIGELANAFDIMTLRLRERTAEAVRLYAEAIQRNQELAETNERLRTTQQQLIQSEKLAAIGQLTAGIVHDVKNPLTVIKGVAELLLTEDDLGEELRSEISLMRESAVKANNIVTDLLKFSRQSKPDLEVHDMRETVEAALRLTAFPIRKAHVQVIKNLTVKPVLMVYDDQQVEQVLVNMISNALQAMPTGGLLRVSMNTESGSLAIEIQDTGIGIPAENLSRIFDPFFTTKPEGEGTGLGLSVSYGIISNHNGRIEVNSIVGQGTTFTILLPIRQMEMAETMV